MPAIISSSDLIKINRDGVDYQATAADLKEYLETPLPDSYPPTPDPEPEPIGTWHLPKDGWWVEDDFVYYDGDPYDLQVWNAAMEGYPDELPDYPWLQGTELAYSPTPPDEPQPDGYPVVFELLSDSTPYTDHALWWEIPSDIGLRNLTNGQYHLWVAREEDKS